MAIEMYFSSLERLLVVSETDSTDMVGFGSAPMSLNGGGSRSEWVGSKLLVGSALSLQPPSLSDSELISVGSGAGDSESDTGLSSSGNG